MAEVTIKNGRRYREATGLLNQDGTPALLPVCEADDCDFIVHGGYHWERMCDEHRALLDCSRCGLLQASEIGGLCGNCIFDDRVGNPTGSLGQPYFEERG